MGVCVCVCVHMSVGLHRRRRLHTSASLQTSIPVSVWIVHFFPQRVSSSVYGPLLHEMQEELCLLRAVGAYGLLCLAIR